MSSKLDQMRNSLFSKLETNETVFEEFPPFEGNRNDPIRYERYVGDKLVSVSEPQGYTRSYLRWCEQRDEFYAKQGRKVPDDLF